jgi:hypothetical protein
MSALRRMSALRGTVSRYPTILWAAKPPFGVS